MERLDEGALDAIVGGAGRVPLPTPRPFGDLDYSGNFVPGRANLQFDNLRQGRAEADADTRAAQFLRDNPQADHVSYEGRTEGGGYVAGVYSRQSLQRDEERLRTGNANGYDGALGRSPNGAITRDHPDPISFGRPGAEPTPQERIDGGFSRLDPERTPQERIDRAFESFDDGSTAGVGPSEGSATRGLDAAPSAPSLGSAADEVGDPWTGVPAATSAAGEAGVDGSPDWSNETEATAAPADMEPSEEASDDAYQDDGRGFGTPGVEAYAGAGSVDESGFEGVDPASEVPETLPENTETQEAVSDSAEAIE